MPRTDIHLDAMLRHLGAAYYESLHGRATRADLIRALDTVEEHLQEEAAHVAGPARASERQRSDERHARPARPPGGWSHRVRDVMTTAVVTVDRITPYKEIVSLLAEHRISGVPVLMMGRQVVGVVTEADLLAAQEQHARRLRFSGRRPSWWWRGRYHSALTAGELMSTPAITIGPDATVPAAARLMDAHHLRRLPVVDEKGTILGVVSRRDLLSVFLRPDAAIAADVRRVLHDVPLADPADVDVSVRNGVVTLAGTIRPAAAKHDDLIPLTIRLMWNVDGVVDIVDKIGEKQEAEPAGQSRSADSTQTEGGR
jgi:CBS domain-containing protein